MTDLHSQVGGFVDEIEIRPIDLLPNMDASAPCRLVVGLFNGEGKKVDIRVTVIARGMKA